MLTVTPFLWFDTQAEEAMNFYASIFPRTKVLSVNRMQGRVLSVEFELEGQKFMALNAGPGQPSRRHEGSPLHLPEPAPSCRAWAPPSVW